MKAKMLGSFVALGFATVASAQISPIGQFTGSQSEGFEAVNSPPFITCLQGRVFNSTADMCTFDPNTGAPSGGTLVTSGWSFDCVIGPAAGGRFYGSANGATEITFDAPVTKFGAMFGSNAPASWIAQGFDVKFFDPANAQIGSTIHVDIPVCGQWNWSGWESTVQVKKVQYIATFPSMGGGFIDTDEMQYDATTTPTCYPDCNGDGALNLSDFGCFQTKFALGDPYADCNGDGVLNLSDFGCFQTKFALGCP